MPRCPILEHLAYYYRGSCQASGCLAVPLTHMFNAPVVLKPSPPSVLIKPVAPTEEVVSAWLSYQELKSKLLNENDYQEIHGKRMIRKSGWRKLSTAFGISDSVVSETRKDYKGYFVIEVVVNATSPNGRSAVGLGSCSSKERTFSHEEHDVRSTAHTRAKNRAISDLIGGGEVSAEEITTDEEDSDKWHNDLFMEEPESNWTPVQDIITHKQRSLLMHLIRERVEDENEQERQLAQMESLSKADASEVISQLMNTPVIG